MDKNSVGIIGLGYVGLPLAREFLKKGFSVIGFDVDSRKIEKLNKGESYIKHITDEFLKEFVLDKKTFFSTDDFSKLKEVESILICVPTPLNEYREPDLSYVVNTTESVSKNLKKGHLVVLESTTYPGTTDEIMLPILLKSGLKVGDDFCLAYSPEREDPGNEKFTTSKIPKVVGGYTEKCSERAKNLYSNIVEVVSVSSTRVAEASKILENTYRAVNIALVNELKMLFDKMDIDVWEVINAAKTKPFGYHAFYPGPGLGGHCIPIDPFYLTWKAREYDFNTRFIELAGDINTYQPYYVINRLTEVLNKFKKSLKGSKILILGMAYKKDIDDVRESPSLKIYELLEEREAVIDYYDPFVKQTGGHRHYPDMMLKSINYSKDKLRDYDLVLLLTDHSAYDYKEILENSNLIFDTRNIFPQADNVYK